jgi:two-component system, cell cycle sensor histidine kinase and response regulator CckA
VDATRILVVEPERGLAADLGRRLQLMGHTVAATASDGEAALDAALRSRPDLVIINGQPDGLLTIEETARRLRKARDIPVVLVTDDDSPTVPSARGPEPFGHILRTFNDRELHSAIEFALYRHRNDAKLRKVERWMSSTLSSLGDAVIATDRYGIVTLINTLAQQLTGWTEREAIGRQFVDVFRVIDGESREPILDLIERALLQGFSIGMDENVFLQPRQGEKLLIDDSIAPVRNDANEVTGVVIVFRDGTERRLADQAIDMLNQQLEHRVLERTAELEAANEALAAFSGSVSHDLRAPLRAVSGFSTMLCERYAHVLDVEGKRFLEIIQSKSLQMTRMIDDFIRLAGLRQGPLKVTQLDSDSMVRQVVIGLAEEDAAARYIVVEPLPDLEGDEGLIRQIWVNLLGNALKFTAKVEHPEIRVSAEEAEGMVNFKVADNGAGFDMAAAGRMFTPFQRMHLERDFVGHGIGLATVAAVVDRHGGRVHAEGKVGEGATFHFSLPKQHRSPNASASQLN